MTITARATLDGDVLQGAEVGVFVADECRASEVTDDKGYAYFTVPGDGKCTLRFKMTQGEQEWTSDVTIDFAEDAICGSYRQPLELTFGKTTCVNGVEADDGADTCWFDVNGIMLGRRPSARACMCVVRVTPIQDLP